MDRFLLVDIVYSSLGPSESTVMMTPLVPADAQELLYPYSRLNLGGRGSRRTPEADANRKSHDQLNRCRSVSENPCDRVRAYAVIQHN
jgi:hypothetical protein